MRKEEAGMSSFIFAIIGVLVLLPILYFSNLGMSLKEKGTVLAAAFFISLIGVVSLKVIPWWVVIFLLIILSGVLTILAIRYLQSVRTETDSDDESWFSTDVTFAGHAEFASTAEYDDGIDEQDIQEDEHESVEYEEHPPTHDVIREAFVQNQEDKREDEDNIEEENQPQAIEEESERVVEEAPATIPTNPIPSFATPEDISPEEELLANRMQSMEAQVDDSPSTLVQTIDTDDDFVLEEIVSTNLQQKQKEPVLDEDWTIDIIEEKEPSDLPEETNQEESSFTDLDDLLSHRTKQHDQ